MHTVGRFVRASALIALIAPLFAFGASPRREVASFEAIASDDHALTNAGDRPQVPPGNAKLWSSSALATPYSETLTEDQRVGGLSKVWSEVKFGFANFDLVPDLDWDAAFLEAIPQVRAARTTLEYYRILARLVAKLHDGHSFVVFPRELRKEAFSRPPVTLRLIEGRLFDVADREEVVKVDGLPLREFAERFVVPWQWSSTPQDLAAHSYEFGLLDGPPGSEVSVTFRDAAGREHERRLVREVAEDSRPAVSLPRIEFTTLPNDVGLLTIRSFADKSVAETFESLLPMVLHTRALVIDIRENGGGNSGYAYNILAHFMPAPFAIFDFRSPRYVPSRRSQNLAEEWEIGATRPWQNREPRYDKAVVVLTSARTYSAAEDFLVAFRAAKRGLIIGEASGGSTGQPLIVKLPGGGAVGICSKRVSFPDGTEFVGRGILPDVPVHPSIDDFLAGRDTVLDAALANLR